MPVAWKPAPETLKHLGNWRTVRGAPGKWNASRNYWFQEVDDEHGLCKGPEVQCVLGGGGGTEGGAGDDVTGSEGPGQASTPRDRDSAAAGRGGVALKFHVLC